METNTKYNASIIDLNDYEHAGEGANGQSFNHKQDSSLMVKLYNPGANIELAYSEMSIARKVFDAGIPSPEPGEFITDGNGRYGIKFRRLINKISYARALGRQPQDVEVLSREFARMCKQLHSTPVDTRIFTNVKEQYLGYLAEDTLYNNKEKAIIENIIKGAPQAATAIHGDLQFGNALICDGKSYFIDLGEFAYGHPYFDLGMTIITAIYNDAAFTKEAFHMHRSTAIQFWEYFVDEYFDGKLTLLEAEQLLLPYAVVKTLLIERNAGCAIPTLHSLIKLL